jgi:hypothetical protein
VLLKHVAARAQAPARRGDRLGSLRSVLVDRSGVLTTRLLLARADSASLVQLARRQGMSRWSGLVRQGPKSRSGRGRSLLPE